VSLTTPPPSLPLSLQMHGAGRLDCGSSLILYWYGKGVPKISTKHQVTVPVAVLEEAGLHAGDQVVVEALGEGEVRIRRGAVSFESAFGALTGSYPPGYLERLDAEDEGR
jgi:AbrB family looped-hinge helix DNA binding protein